MITATIITFSVFYLIFAWISHYHSMMFGGSVIPEWLCIFCLYEKIIRNA